MRPRSAFITSLVELVVSYVLVLVSTLLRWGKGCAIKQQRIGALIEFCEEA